MRVTTLLRRLTGVTGVTQMYVKGAGLDRRRSADGVGGAVAAAFPMRRVREAGAAVRPAAGPGAAPGPPFSSLE